MKIVVTRTQSKVAINSQIDEFLAVTNLDFVERKGHSIEQLQDKYNAVGVIVWHPEGPILHLEKQKFFFHPSMAKTRISLYRNSNIADPLIQACNISGQDKILDCTLGLGADAIVASFFNPDGLVIGLESASPIAWIVKWGMKLYQSKMSWLNEAIQRIQVINANHLDYLKYLPDNSFDIVYFDPMFRKPLLKSAALSPLRLIANHEPLSMETIHEACRVARKRVVVKELASSLEFSRLGIDKFTSSPNNKITYGIMEL